MLNSAKFAVSVSVAFSSALGLVQIAEASDLNSVIYGGVGSQSDTEIWENDDTTYALGFMTQSKDSKLVLGLDIGFEGTLLDSTYNQNSVPDRGVSYNFLLGTNIVNSTSWHLDGAFLIGFREETISCDAQSYLGFQCYADTDPNTDYTTNYGGVLMVSYKSIAFGLRVTEVSSQALLGFRF